MKKATLKQIADMAGVSMTTVHRALNGKGGCSKEVQQLICQIAEEQGYNANPASSSAYKPPLQIAMIFPFRENGGRYGMDHILDGYLEYRRELKGYHIVYQEFLLRSSEQRLLDYLDMPYEELERVLQQILMEQPVRFDGVIIYGMSVTRRAEAILKRIVSRGTKVIVLDRVLPSIEEACTVKADNEMAGNMAGEILCQNLRRPGTVAIIRQLVPTGDPAAEACKEFIRQERPELRLVELPLLMTVNMGKTIAEFLRVQPDLVGVYATSGRHTKSLVDALNLLEIKEMTAIGSELFEESHQALHSKVLSAVLDKRPAKIGFTALHILVTSLVKEEPMPPLTQIPPRIIIRSNSDVYFVKREYLHESDAYCD